MRHQRQRTKRLVDTEIIVAAKDLVGSLAGQHNLYALCCRTCEQHTRNFHSTYYRILSVPLRFRQELEVVGSAPRDAGIEVVSGKIVEQLLRADLIHARIVERERKRRDGTLAELIHES